MLYGFFLGVAACAIWGLIYLVPLMLPQYDPVLIACGRFFVYGMVCVAIAPFQWKTLQKLTHRDWFTALRLVIFGHLVYYWCLSSCVSFSGPPLAGMMMAWIPVLVAIIANARAKRQGQGLAWKRLLPPLSLLLLGMIVANWTEFQYYVYEQETPAETFALGIIAGVAGLLLWTWYPIRNADWLLAHRDVSPQAWITAQGLMVLPVSTVSYFVAANVLLPADVGLLGETPLRMIWVMLMAGVACSWLAGALWNAMSQNLPPALGGQLIVFETIFSVIYAHIWRAEWPTWSMTVGMIMLLVGVVASLRAFR